MKHLGDNWYKADISIVSSEENLMGDSNRAKTFIIFNMKNVDQFYGTYSYEDFEDGGVPDATAVSFKNGQENHILVPLATFEEAFMDYQASQAMGLF